jgi:hypothetical protein
MLGGILEAIGVLASLIGIWEFVSRLALTRRIGTTLGRVFSKKTRPIHKILVDPEPLALSNVNRYAFLGSFRSKTRVRPSTDLDVAAFLQ